jgi:transposase
VVNPPHIKGMKGRKTDVQDSQWIAHLLQMGALPPSYIPTRPQRERREVVRYRKTLIQARSAEANRLQTVLEGAYLKLGSVLSDILGKTGQRILGALVQGETYPATLTALADDRVRATPETLAAALQGLIGAHQPLMLRLQLEHVAFLDRQIEAWSDEMGARLSHEEDALTRLETIPGVGRRTAETIVAEVGTEMPRVPSAGHLVSWPGFSPG